MSYLYPTMEDAREYLPVALQALRGQMPEADVGVKAAHTMSGYGFSLYPGEPGVFGNEAAVCEAPANYGASQAADDLEAYFAEASFGAAGDEPVKAKAIPWLKIAQILFALFVK